MYNTPCCITDMATGYILYCALTFCRIHFLMNASLRSSLTTDCGITIDVCRLFPNREGSATKAVPGVLLVGWFMANKKHMQRYIDTYLELGYNSFCVVLPADTLMLYSESRVQNYTRSILATLAERRELYLGGLIVHTFSNGGSIIMPTIASMRNKEYNYNANSQEGLEHVVESIRGVVFECGPGYMDYGKLELATTTAVGKNPILRMIAKNLVYISNLRLSFLYGKSDDNSSQGRVHWDLFWDNFKFARYNCPEFYIYAKSDEIIDYEKLEELISYREINGTGSIISKYRVENSDHVKIILEDPDGYKRGLSSFLDSLRYT